jgi:hypothetical protein
MDEGQCSSDTAAFYLLSPQKSYLVLTTNVPHGAIDVLVLDRLHIETHGGRGVDYLAQLELIQNGRLACRIEAHHQQAAVLVRDHAVPQCRYIDTHYCSLLLLMMEDVLLMEDFNVGYSIDERVAQEGIARKSTPPTK